MSEKLFVGVGRLSLFFRQARNLKDKRNQLQSLKQKLRNQGWSVSEVGHTEDPKRGFLGFVYTGNSHHQVELAFEQVLGLLIGNFEVVRKTKEILEFDADPTFDDSLLARSLLGDTDES